jgi:ABC-type lipoprotein release transport system permease subunit
LNPLTLPIVSVILGSVTLLATWLPARRAAKVDPFNISPPFSAS